MLLPYTAPRVGIREPQVSQLPTLTLQQACCRVADGASWAWSSVRPNPVCGFSTGSVSFGGCLSACRVSLAHLSAALTQAVRAAGHVQIGPLSPPLANAAAGHELDNDTGSVCKHLPGPRLALQVCIVMQSWAAHSSRRSPLICRSTVSAPSKLHTCPFSTENFSHGGRLWPGQGPHMP